MRINKTHAAIWLCIILMAIVCILVAMACGVMYEKWQHECPELSEPHTCVIPDPWQQQTILQEQGYDLGTDGIDGNLGCADSNSQIALQLYWNTMYAERSMTPKGVPNE